MKTLKLPILFISLLFSGLLVQAQPMKSGIAKPYSASIPGWFTSLDEANAISVKTGKPIMANFTGSDWCGWCKKLRREVFDTPEFQKWADENVVLLELDYPRSFQVPDNIKQQNQQLQQVLGVRGYPTIWLFTLTNNDKGQANINPLGKTGYVAGGPAKFISVAQEQMLVKK
ncbi:MAG: thiol-disulfide isomerase/thioredoxin [Salibacteraceae bacterium]|jgi:thiol-disulfide isomerase/thioredoxin